MKNLLVTIEFEAHSNLLLAKAKELAVKFDAKIWLIHIAAPERDFVGYDVGPDYIRDSRAEELRSQHRELQGFAEDLISDGLNAQALLIQGTTTESLLEEAEKLQCDLIIIGHHVRGWVYNLFNKGTDVSLLDKADIPVMIVPFNITED